jgi:class 3 adenylate cyclase/tetratricopeptide (TPR) repeat protein
LSIDIRDWLDGLGLSQYADAFSDNDLDLDLVADLSDSDLKDLGVTSMGHRKKLLRAIEALAAGNEPAPVEGVPTLAPATPAQAERRQLTVLFCDLVGSTALSRQLDPEDLRDLMRRYQEAVADAMTRYDGHVAKYLGDGVLAYFGWPLAHEDQAERAVHAGLAAIAATAGLPAGGTPLTARVGIATGLVVVGDLAGESDAIAGETPNLAARLQALAAPGEVVIGETTRRMVAAAFDLRDLGATSLKGFADPVPAWVVTAARESESRFETAHASGLTPLVGRDQELALMRERWRRACGGDGQVVLLSGDAGIGKSRLLAALDDAVADDTPTRIRFQCSPYHMDSAFHPFVRQLELAAGFRPEDDGDLRLDKVAALIGGGDLDAAAVATIMALPIESRFGVIELTPQQLKLRAGEVLLRHLRELAVEKPVLFAFEDLHWVDPSSQELLNRIATEIADSRVLAVMTHRPEYQAPFLSAGNNVTALTLTYLGRAEITDMVRAVAGHDIDPVTLDQIIARTDGIPLYVEEMTKSVTEAEAGASEVPDTLQASLLSRLDRLGAAKEIAQIGAVIGRNFDFSMLERITEHRTDDLVDAIDRLVGALLVFQSGIPPDARFTFKHALVQDAAYDSLLKSRRGVLHGRIAAALERDFPSIVENEPEILARHHSAAGNTESAIAYWRQAGERAAALSSGLEARNHFERAIALLETLPPDAARDTTELALRLGQAWAIQLTRGPADTELGQAYARALELSGTVGEPAQRIAATFGMWRHNFWRNGVRASVRYSDDLWSISETSGNVSDRVVANYVKATTQMSLGDERAGMAYAKVAWDLYKGSSETALTYRLGHNQGISSLLIMSCSAGALGQPTVARSSVEEVLDQAQAMADPLTLTIVSGIAATIYELLGEERSDIVESARAIASEYGFDIWVGYADTCLGWLKHLDGDSAAGLDLMEQGLAAWQAAGAKAFAPGRMGLYGRMCLEAGQLDRARRVLTDGERLAQETGEIFWLTEIHRYLGVLTMAENGDPSVAEDYFRRALADAQKREAYGFALRAAIDLARHLDGDGRGAEGREIVADVLTHFDAKDDSADLRAARAL